MIKISEVPEQYKYQVWRFLTYYPNSGQDIAKRYLALVTSSEYRNSQNRSYRKPIPTKKIEVEPSRPTVRDQTRLTIIGEICLNPGKTSKHIADATGIPVHSVRMHLIQLRKEGLIEGYADGRSGYFLTPKP